jgi:NAD(P)-dependent dehydrogenase (short-subunit alcohol dehydrogenase family)
MIDLRAHAAHLANQGVRSVDTAKSVIVTGGTYGIGRGIVLELARQGWRVVAFGLDGPVEGSAAKDGIAGTRAALAEAGLEAEVVEGDVSRATDVDRVVAHALDRFGRVDALVNNAAIRPAGTVLETDEATFERVVAVNLKGPYLMARAVIPLMRAQDGGAIVNIGSGAGWGKPDQAAYGAAKGGLAALSKALAYDHLADGIRVNLVVPGPGTMSGMVEAMIAAGKSPPPPVTASGRPTTAEDVARAVAFLLSDDAAQISGTVLDVGTFAGQGGAGQPRS